MFEIQQKPVGRWVRISRWAAWPVAAGLVVAAVVVATVTLGRDGTVQTAQAVDNPPPAEGRSPVVLQMLEDGTLTNEELQSTPLAAEILADGVITEAEYERSVMAAIQCAEDKGLSISRPIWREELDKRTLNFGITFPAGKDSIVDIDLWDDCDREYFMGVAIAWVDQFRPTDAEMQERREDYLACMTAAGIPMATWDEYLDRRPFTERADSLINRDCKLESFRGLEAPPS